MSVTMKQKEVSFDYKSLVKNFVMKGNEITIVKSKRKLPKYLQYSPTVRGGDDTNTNSLIFRLQQHQSEK